MPQIKVDTHIVIKREWLNALTQEERARFYWLLDRITFLTKKKTHSYIVCNTDESYAQEVLDLILEREKHKEES